MAASQVFWHAVTVLGENDNESGNYKSLALDVLPCQIGQ